MVNRVFDVDWGVVGLDPASGNSSLHYQVLAGDDTSLVARSNTGLKEFPAGSGLYRVVVSVDPAWQARIVWDDGTRWSTESFVPMSVADVEISLESSDVSVGISSSFAE